MKRDFELWLEENSLKRIEACNLAVAPYDGVNKFFHGKNPGYNIKKRFHILTGLKSFDLTNKETSEYFKQKATKPLYEDLEKIALFFTDRWKTRNIHPFGDEIMNMTASKFMRPPMYISKNLQLLDSLKNMNESSVFSTHLEGEVSHHDENVDYYSQLLRNGLDSIVCLFQRLYTFEGKKFNHYLEMNADKVTQLTELLQHLSKDNPQDSRKKSLKKQKSF